MQLVRRIGILCLALGLAAPNAFAAEPDAKCASKKLKFVGLYAACVLKADAKAKLKGTEPDYTNCEETFAKKFGKAEEKAGPGICPTEGDLLILQGEVDSSAAELAEQLEAADPNCPMGYRDRSPGQVVQDLYQAYAAHDAQAITCNYHPSASVITDQGVLVGYNDIVTFYFSLFDLFNGVSYTVGQIDEFGKTVRVLNSLNAGWVEIPDGIDTFIVKRGRIRTQTNHGLIKFNGPPPE